MERHHKLAFPVLLLPLVIGCASPGPPRPPSLQLPTAARDLHAQRIGATVVLDWTIPINTTDGDSIRGPVTSILCRKLGAGPCAPIGSYDHTPGPQHITDTLPAALLTGAPRLLEYRIDLANDHHRSAGTPASVFTVAGMAPPPVQAFAVTPRRGGALLTWAATSSPAVMQVQRTLVNQPAKPVAATPSPAARKSKAPALPGASPKGPPGQVTLVADATLATDPGGLLDTSARPAEPYVYLAQRVQMVKLGGRSLEVRGLPSPATPFTYVDTFPPATPAGLVTIPGGGFGVAPSIDLSWDPVTDRDVAGYNLYRADGSGQFQRMNAKPVPAPAYRDLTVQPGHPYMYRVTAVDLRGNESPATAVVKETASQ